MSPGGHAAVGGPRAPKTDKPAASAARASSRRVTAPTGRSRPPQSGHRSASTSNTFASSFAHATRYRVAWAKLLAKVFDVDAERCPDCGGRLRPVGAVTRREEARAALAAGLSVLGARGPPTAA